MSRITYSVRIWNDTHTGASGCNAKIIKDGVKSSKRKYFRPGPTIRSIRIISLLMLLKKTEPGDRIVIKTNDEDLTRYINRSITNEWGFVADNGSKLYKTIQKIVEIFKSREIKAIPLVERNVKTIEPQPIYSSYEDKAKTG